MSTVLYYEAVSYSGVSWRVNLIDTEKPGATPVETAGVAPVFNYEGESELHPYTPILFSKVSAEFLVQDNDQLSLIEDALQSDKEDRFYLEVLKEGSVEWRGIILSEQVVLPRQAKPFKVAISATDGLKLLERKEDPLFIASFTEQLRGLLVATKIANIYSTSEPYFTVAADYWDINHGPAFTAADPLRYTRILNSETHYLIEQEDTRDKYVNYLQRLKDILHLFGLQLKMCRGRYVIFQLDIYDQGTVLLHNYTKDIDFLNNTQVATGSATTEIFTSALNVINEEQELEGGEQSYAPPVRQVNAVLDNKLILYPRTQFANIQNGIGLGSVLNTTSNDTLLLRLEVNLFVSGSSLSAFPAVFDVIFEVTIKVGSSYYDDSGNTPVWSTTPVSNTVSRRAFPPVTTSANYSMSFISSQPYDFFMYPVSVNGAVTVTVTGRVQDVQGNTISGVSAGGTSGYMELLYTNAVNPDEVSVTFGTNQESSYEIDLPRREIIVNNGILNPATLQIYDGSNWIYSTEWKRFSSNGVGGSLTFLVMSALYRRQQRTLHVYNISLINASNDALRLLNMDDKGFILQRGTYNTETDVWNGSWIEYLAYDDSTGTGLSPLYRNPKSPGLQPAAGNNGQSNKRAETSNSGTVPLAYTNATLQGTISTVEISASTGRDLAQTEDRILIINPVNGQSEELILTAPWTASATDLSVQSTSLERSYPPGSQISIPLFQLAARITALED